MACGRAVIVYDYQGGEGIITKKNIEEIKKCNFSGRRFAKKYTVDDLVKEIKKYKKEMGKVNRKIVLKDYNVKLATDEILKTCKEAEETFQFKKIPVPHKELLWFLEELNKIYNSKAWKGINKIYEMKNWISYIWKK